MADKRKATVTPTISDAELDKMAAKVKELYKDMPKVKVKIPKSQLNKDDLVVTVCINGYIWQMNRGETVEIPEEVARILEESGYLG